MKKWIALCLAVIMALSLCACADSGKTEEKDEAKEGDGEKVGIATTGKLTEMVILDDDGDTRHKYTFSYDDNHNIIGEKLYEYGVLYIEKTYNKDIDKPLQEVIYEGGKVQFQAEYSYDANGNCLEEKSTLFNGEARISRTIKTYDANGNVLTEKEYEGDELFCDYTYTYTATGKMATKVEVRYEENTEHYNTAFAYDEHDNLLSRTTVSNYGTSTDTYENTYDENGKLVEVQVYNDGTLKTYKKYDTDGNLLVKSRYDYEGNEDNRIVYTYENGNLVKEVSYSGDEECTVEVRTYNAEGNLIELSYTDLSGTWCKVYTYNQNGAVTGTKLYRNDELYEECFLIYENVTVSKETAEKMEEVIRKYVR